MKLRSSPMKAEYRKRADKEMKTIQLQDSFRFLWILSCQINPSLKQFFIRKLLSVIHTGGE